MTQDVGKRIYQRGDIVQVENDEQRNERIDRGLPPCGVPAPLIPYATRLTAHPTHESVPGYWQQHVNALTHPRRSEAAIGDMLSSWLLYADTYRERYQSGIGEDSVLGPEWAAIGVALRGLLNGECGRIDCGAVDAVICETLKDEEFDPGAL